MPWSFIRLSPTRLPDNTVIECTDRDAAYVLDGLLYNESDLALEEHYTDTHGYTEINFAAFAMLGRRFAPRIRGLQHQRIYRIDKEKIMDQWHHWSNAGTHYSHGLDMRAVGS